MHLPVAWPNRDAIFPIETKSLSTYLSTKIKGACFVSARKSTARPRFRLGIEQCILVQDQQAPHPTLSRIEASEHYELPTATAALVRPTYNAHTASTKLVGVLWHLSKRRARVILLPRLP